MYDEIFKDLSLRYNKATLTKKELAHELNLSIHTINARIVKGLDLPDYKKIGNAKNSKVVFPIVAVAEYLSNTIKIFKNGYQ